MTRVVCGISRGDPPLEISWLKDGIPVSAKFGVNISTLDPYSSLLRIPNLTASHTGEYTCVAVNPAAQVRYSSKLQVKGNSLNYKTPANFRAHVCLSFQTLLAHSPAELKCIKKLQSNNKNGIYASFHKVTLLHCFF